MAVHYSFSSALCFLNGGPTDCFKTKHDSALTQVSANSLLKTLFKQTWMKIKAFREGGLEDRAVLHAYALCVNVCRSEGFKVFRYYVCLPYCGYCMDYNKTTDNSVEYPILEIHGSRELSHFSINEPQPNMA